jgi:hypothetical protein
MASACVVQALGQVIVGEGVGLDTGRGLMKYGRVTPSEWGQGWPTSRARPSVF